MIKKFLILAILSLFMIGCTVVETTGPDYNEEIKIITQRIIPE